MELGSYFCPVPLDHSDALLRRRYLRFYLSPARMVVLYTRIKFRSLSSSNGDDDTTPLYYYAVVIAWKDSPRFFPRGRFNKFNIIACSGDYMQSANGLRNAREKSLHAHLRYDYPRYNFTLVSSVDFNKKW